MSTMRGFDAAQREYDNRTPPEDGPSECPDCYGTGQFDLAHGEGVFAHCKTCNGFGYINDDGSPHDPEQAARDADEYADMRRDERMNGG